MTLCGRQRDARADARSIADLDATRAGPQQRLVIRPDSGVLLAVIPNHPCVERAGDADHFTDEGLVWMLGE